MDLDKKETKNSAYSLYSKSSHVLSLSEEAFMDTGYLCLSKDMFRALLLCNSLWVFEIQYCTNFKYSQLQVAYKQIMFQK
jgi:hypothetical protein